jgi:predicted acetyltransferase
VAIEIRPQEEQDDEADLRLMHQSFTYSEAQSARYRNSRLDERRVAVRDGELLATMGFTRAAQLFGGHPIPAALVHGVKTAPEARGRGIGTQLAAHVLRELRSDGVAICTLDPSTTAPYRRQGYELAATSVRYRMPIATLPRDTELGVERWEDSDLRAIEALYHHAARASSGMIERNSAWWIERVLHERQGPVYRYLVRNGDAIEGYIVHTQPPAAAHGAAGSLAFDVDARDLHWCTERAALALLAYVGSHRGICRAFGWIGPLADPLGLLLAWEEVRVVGTVPWMSRLLDVSTALVRRGYDEEIVGSVQLEVIDPLLTENSLMLRLEVGGGSATVTPVTQATVRIDVGTLAAIFSGWLRACDAARAGRIPGGDASTIATLDRIFPAGTPWLSDTF